MANGRNGRVTRVVGHDNKRICDAQGRLEEGPFDLGKMWKSSDSAEYLYKSITSLVGSAVRHCKSFYYAF